MNLNIQMFAEQTPYIEFKDLPDTSTPIDSENLNNIQKSIKDDISNISNGLSGLYTTISNCLQIYTKDYSYLDGSVPSYELLTPDSDNILDYDYISIEYDTYSASGFSDGNYIASTGLIKINKTGNTLISLPAILYTQDSLWFGIRKAELHIDTGNEGLVKISSAHYCNIKTLQVESNNDWIKPTRICVYKVGGTE